MGKEFVLITGATGFIGSNVVKNLIKEKAYTIVAVVRKDKDYKNVNELKNNGVILIKGDFYDKKIIDKVFNQFPVNFVIHIAALRGAGQGDKKQFLKVNVEGTENLLAASLRYKIKRFVFCSSVGVFGTIPREIPAGINTELMGDNEYHLSKILAEMKVNEFITKGLDAYIIRPAITYGANDNGFPSMLIDLVRKRILLFSKKDIKIHLLDVNSLAQVITELLKSPGLIRKTFILADENPILLQQIVNIINRNYRASQYPAFLRLPSVFFVVLEKFLRLTGNQKWLTRIMFVSKSWYYDINDSVEMLNFKPSKTEEIFVMRMGIQEC